MAEAAMAEGRNDRWPQWPMAAMADGRNGRPVFDTPRIRGRQVYLIPRASAARGKKCEQSVS